jgi:hypothetical protein
VLKTRKTGDTNIRLQILELFLIFSKNCEKIGKVDAFWQKRCLFSTYRRPSGCEKATELSRIFSPTPQVILKSTTGNTDPD